MNNISRLTSSVTVAIIITVFPLFVSCDKDQKQDIKLTEDQFSREKAQFKVMSKPNQEAVAVLSFIYQMKPEDIEQFLDGYLSETDYYYRGWKDDVKQVDKHERNDKVLDLMFLDKEKYLQELDRAARSTGISVEKAAAIVRDYRIFGKGNGSHE